MKLRICIIVTDAISLNILYKDQLEYYKKQDVSLTLICGGNEEELKKLKDRDIGRVIHIGLTRKPALLRDLISLFRLCAFLIFNRFDVVVSTTPKAIFLGGLACFFSKQRRRIVLFQGRVYENYQGSKRIFYSYLDKISIILSSETLFVSESLKQAYETERLISPGKGVVIGAGSVNGVDTNVFCSARYDFQQRQTIRQSLSIPEDWVVALSVGRVCPDKGLHEIIDLAERMRGSKIVFVWVGDVEPGYEEMESRLVATSKVKRVQFTTNVPQFFAAADVHLFLSYREGFGNVALEAASFGLPTISYDIVGPKDSVNEGISGIRVPLGDIDAVQRNLESILIDKSAFRKRFHSSDSWAEENFSQPIVWARYLDFFQKKVRSAEPSSYAARGAR